MARTIEYRIPAAFDGEKLIRFLRGSLAFSARAVTRLRHTPGALTLNGAPVRTVDPVHTDDLLTVTLPEENCEMSQSAADALDIVYEDADVLVLNKPGDLALHPTHNHQGDTLANQVAAYFAAKGAGVPVFRAVGRLDKFTSGLVLCALNKVSAAKLSGNYEKQYLAVVGGSLSGSGTIDAPICRPDPNKTLRAVGSPGERAVTHWESLITTPEMTLVRVKLETGRTHQIRVHFAHLGMPLAGDTMYGGNDALIPRAALHCERLTFLHPIHAEPLSFCVPPPPDMQAVLDVLKNAPGRSQ